MTGKYPPTYGDLFPYVIERGGTSPDGVEMESSGPWPVTNIDTPAEDEANVVPHRTPLCHCTVLSSSYTFICRLLRLIKLHVTALYCSTALNTTALLGTLQLCCHVQCSESVVKCLT